MLIDDGYMKSQTNSKKRENVHTTKGNTGRENGIFEILLFTLILNFYRLAQNNLVSDFLAFIYNFKCGIDLKTNKINKIH